MVNKIENTLHSTAINGGLGFVLLSTIEQGANLLKTNYPGNKYITLTKNPFENINTINPLSGAVMCALLVIVDTIVNEIFKAILPDQYLNYNHFKFFRMAISIETTALISMMLGITTTVASAAFMLTASVILSSVAVNTAIASSKLWHTT